MEKILPLAGFFWVWGLDAGEDSFKEENKSNEKFGQFFAANFAAYSHYIVTQKLRRKLRRQNFASKKVPTKSRQLFAVDKLISCPCGHLHKQTCMFIGMNLATIEQK